MIGLLKRTYPDSEVYITPTAQDVDAMLDLGVHVVALDGTLRPRPKGHDLKALIDRIHRRKTLAMADCDSLESAMAAVAAGADLVGTTLAGYTKARPATDGPDLELLREVIRGVGVPVIAEGRYAPAVGGRRGPADGRGGGDDRRRADDRQQIERALTTVRTGEVAQYEYRLIRPSDGTICWLRDTSFPIRDEHGAITRIGGIAEDLTPEAERQIYVVGARAAEARHLAAVVRSTGHRARIFEGVPAFLDIAPVLSPGCVLVDLRGSRRQNLSIPRELKARSIALPTIALDSSAADVASAITAMKAGAIDYLIVTEDESFRSALAKALAECQGSARPTTRDEQAASRVARLKPREREVLVHLLEGGTNKTIGQKLGISPRTVELHRAQVMHRLDVSSLTELLQVALAAGIAPHA